MICSYIQNIYPLPCQVSNEILNQVCCSRESSEANLGSDLPRGNRTDQGSIAFFFDQSAGRLGKM